VALNLNKGSSLTESESVQAFIEQVIIPRTQDLVDEWSGWREKQLWTLEVNEMMKVNASGIQKLLEHYYKPMQKFMDKESACLLFSSDSEGVNLLLEKDAAFCYGMSKHINIIDTKNIAKSK
jgi:hypothetical protein